jgi:hypothetical protein
VLTAYFGDAAAEGERGEAGPLESCTWRDAASNSLLIQVATDYAIFRPDPCRGCIDLSFGDDGYATGSGFQSTAKVIQGGLWLSVTTTGFGDDQTSIASLLETVLQTATSGD